MLTIRLFGPMSLELDDVRAGPRVDGRERALLALLLLRWPRTTSRARVIDSLWRDQSPASGQHCLSTALWRLRTLLAGLADIQIDAPRRSGELGVQITEGVEIDCLAFIDLVEPVVRPAIARTSPRLTTDERHRLETATALYQGELLEGVDDDWIAHDRRRLHDDYLDALHLLGSHFADTAQYDRAARCFTDILRWDLLREDVHRSLMTIRHNQGRRGRALDQYRLCTETLWADLGVEVAEETRLLADAIRRPRDEGQANPIAPPAPDDPTSLRDGPANPATATPASDRASPDRGC